MDDDQKVVSEGEETVEAEIVEPAASSDATVLTSLDELIKTYVSSIDKLKIELKTQKDMLQDGLMNDAVYREHEEKVQEATKVRNATKSQIMKQPGVMQIADKAKTLAAELKEKNTALSDYLLEYQRLSGANQFETDDGQILEIVNTARIVRKSAKN